MRIPKVVIGVFLLLFILGCSQGDPGSPSSSAEKNEAAPPSNEVDIQIPESGGESAVQAPEIGTQSAPPPESAPAPTTKEQPASILAPSSNVNQPPSLAMTLDGKSVASGASVSLPIGGTNEQFVIQANDPEKSIETVAVVETNPKIDPNQILLSPIGGNQYLVTVSDKIVVPSATITVAVWDRPVSGGAIQQSKATFSVNFVKAVPELPPPPPPPATHLTCQNSQCKPADGAGTDQCKTNDECAQKIGKALKFDGYNDYVTVNSTPQLSPSEAITVMAWVKKDKKDKPTDVDHVHFVRKGSEYTLDTGDNGGTLRFTVNGQWGLGLVPYPNDGEWHHVAGTYDKNAGKIRTYIDGEQPKNKDGKAIEYAYNGYINPPPASPSTNLWTGGGDFESGTEGFSSYPNGSFSIAQDDAKFGTHSLLIGFTGQRNAGGVYGATMASMPTLTAGKTYTISLWAKTIANTGNVRVSVGSSSDASCLSFDFTPTTTWQQYSKSCTIDAHRPYMYFWGTPNHQFLVDGFSITVSGNTPPPASQPLRIGGRSDLYTENMKGLIDEVCIYNRALSSEEIQNVKKGGCIANMNGIVGYWPLDEGEGNITMNFSNPDEAYPGQTAFLLNDNYGSKFVANSTDKNVGKTYKTWNEIQQGLKDNDTQTTGPAWVEGVLAENTKFIARRQTAKAAGVQASGISLNGLNEYLVVAPPDKRYVSDLYTITLGNFSVCGWFKSKDRGAGVIGNGVNEPGSFLMHVAGYGTAPRLLRMRIIYSGGSAEVGTYLPDDDFWHFGCGVVDYKNVFIYLDGEMGSLGLFKGAKTKFDGNIVIGGDRYLTSNLQYCFNPQDPKDISKIDSEKCSAFMRGDLKNFQFFKRALTPAEIREQYNFGFGKPADSAKDKDLVAYWKFNEEKGVTKIADSSDYRNDALLITGPPPTPPSPDNLWLEGGDFEVGAEGFKNYPNGSFSIAQDDAKSGTHSLLINIADTRNGGGVYGGTWAPMPALTAGKAYTISFWAKGIVNPGSAHVSVQNGNGDENCLSFEFETTTVWQQYSKSCTIDVHKVNMYIWGSPNQQLLMDSLSITSP